MELLKTECREIVSARLLVIFLRTVQFVLQERCRKAQGLFQQPVFLVLRDSFLMPDVNLHCMTLLLVAIFTMGLRSRQCLLCNRFLNI